MKAFVLNGVHDYCIKDVKRPKPRPREVLVKVKAAGLCGSDIPRIFSTGAYSYPLIPGHEFSGIVAGTGPGADRRWEGRRVGVFPLIPCGKCAPCREGRYEMCRSYGYLGSRADGGFAEYAAVPEWNLIQIPENVSYEAAAMLEPMAVAVHAMRAMGPGKEETVAVCGLGTIGLLLAMFLKEAGVNRLLVVGNKELQRETILGMGIPAGHYCDSRKEDAAGWIVERTHGLGADVLFECVGKKETIATAINGAAPGGRVLLAGNPGSGIGLGKDTYWKILRNQLTIKGSWNSSFYHGPEDDWHYALGRLAQGKVHPEQYITHTFALEDMDKGLRLMRDKTEEYSKVMVI